MADAPFISCDETVPADRGRPQAAFCSRPVAESRAIARKDQPARLMIFCSDRSGDKASCAATPWSPHPASSI